MKCKYSKHSWIVHALQRSRKKLTYINSNTCQRLLFTWPNLAREQGKCDMQAKYQEKESRRKTHWPENPKISRPTTKREVLNARNDVNFT